MEGTLEADKRAHMLNMLKVMEQVVLPLVCSCVQTLFNRTSVSLVRLLFRCNVRESKIEILCKLDYKFSKLITSGNIVDVYNVPT